MSCNLGPADALSVDVASSQTYRSHGIAPKTQPREYRPFGSSKPAGYLHVDPMLPPIGPPGAVGPSVVL